jgi:two-component system OmpR family sensor kinase
MRGYLRRIPLRVKLVVAVLALVTAALGVIGVVSAFEMRSYLINRTDGELVDTARTFSAATAPAPGSTGDLLLPPSDYYIAIGDVYGNRQIWYRPRGMPLDELPVVQTDLDTLRRIGDKPFTARSEDRHLRWRVLVTQLPNNGLILIVGANLSNVDSAVDRLVGTELLVGTAVLMMLAAAGIGIVRASLKPLIEIEHTAAAIAGGDLARRVPESDPETEVGRLAHALNTMLAQIEGAFTARAASEEAARRAASAAQVSERRARRSEERMRQFVADASHELRTPLTSIRGFAELYRQGAAREPEQTEALLRRVEDEAARMGLLVEDLLLLARLDEERPLALAPVPLRPVAVDAVAAARAVAPERDVTLEVAPDAGDLVVLGDDARLRQIVGNLMTNALTHTPSGAPVTLRLCAEPDPIDQAAGERSAAGQPRVGAGAASATQAAGASSAARAASSAARAVAGQIGAGQAVAARSAAGQAVIEVVDKGPGLQQDQAERVFERFYRVDKARTRQAAGRMSALSPHSGTGLGLAIVAALVAAHGGRVEVQTAPGAGATFRVRLPLALPESSQRQHSPVEVASANLEA